LIYPGYKVVSTLIILGIYNSFFTGKIW